VITADVSQTDINRLVRLTNVAKKTARDNVEKTVIRLTIWAVQSAAKATPTAKNRRYNKVKSWGKARKESEGVPDWAEFRVQWWSKDGSKTWAYAGNPEAKKRLIYPRYKGAAKAGWWKPIRGLGGKVPATPKDAKPKNNIHRLVGTIRKSKVAGKLTAVEITNKIEYVSKIAPNAADIGITNATNRFIGNEKQRIERAIERGWKGVI